MSPKIVIDLNFLNIECGYCSYHIDNFCTLFNKGIVKNYRVPECKEAEHIYNMLTIKYKDY